VRDLSIVEKHKGRATHVNLEDGRRTLDPRSNQQHESSLVVWYLPLDLNNSSQSIVAAFAWGTLNRRVFVPRVHAKALFHGVGTDDPLRAHGRVSLRAGDRTMLGRSRGRLAQ
jgi:hypothetical protein